MKMSVIILCFIEDIDGKVGRIAYFTYFDIAIKWLFSLS